MRKSIFILPVVLSFMLAPPPCRAWNSTGHELVAQIAYDNLSPEAKTKIVGAIKHHARLQKDLLLDVAPDEDTDRAIFLRAATWPDMVRSPQNPLQRTEGHSVWHYVDFPYEADGVKGTPIVEQWDGKSDPVNLLQAMQKMRAQLSDPATKKDRDAIDLCWVEHLTGDIHQPLHAVSWFSKEYPNGDRGGNDVIVQNKGDIIAGQPDLPPPATVNLHTLWDDIEGFSLDPAVIRKNADRIEQAHPASEFGDRIKDMDVSSWAKESLSLAREKVYLNGTLPHVVRDQGGPPPDEAPKLPDDYETNARAVADQRIALAGYRLAAELEEIAKGLPAN